MVIPSTYVPSFYCREWKLETKKGGSQFRTFLPSETNIELVGPTVHLLSKIQKFALFKKLLLAR